MEVAPPAVPPGVVQQVVPESPAALPPKPLTPSASSRPTPVSHRIPKFKTSDQPVVLPASFGSGLEKVGMQFGSLGLGGDDFDAPPYVLSVYVALFIVLMRLIDMNPLLSSRSLSRPLLLSRYPHLPPSCRSLSLLLLRRRR